MSALSKPFAYQAPILNETPALDDWGQLVRHVGPIDANIISIDPGVVFPVVIEQPPDSTITAVAQSTVSVVLAAANADRRGLTIYNNSNRVLFVRAATGAATLSNWTVRLDRNDYYELPFPVYTGDVAGIWASGSGGFAQVTEFTV
jgi:hypothetical protein